MGFEIVVIGTSIGGLKALQKLLSQVSDNFSLPLVVVQHRGKEVGNELRDYLAQASVLPVKEPEDKEPILPGYVYLAPRDYHLLVNRGSFALSIDLPIEFARPSIDVLFQSAADEYGEGAIGVILTGSNHDGASGLAAIKARGGTTLVETPATAACPQMPEAAIAKSEVDWVLPLEEIVERLEKLNNGIAAFHAN